ncbi:MAG: hypothetical protein ACJAQ4_001835 [Cryomorphaceae bacterium]|jgi:hypothetical protein
MQLLNCLREHYGAYVSEKTTAIVEQSIKKTAWCDNLRNLISNARNFN